MPTCRPNRSTGTRTRLSVQDENCWGNRQYSGDGNGGADQEAIGWDFSSETLRNDINNIDSGLIRSDRMRNESQQGNHRPGGDINGELQPHGPWPFFLKHVLGGTVTTTGSSPYVHSMLGSVELPEGFTVEKRYGFPDGSYRYLQYLGCRANEFALQVPTEGPVTCRAGILARQELSVGTSMDDTPTYPSDNEPYVSFNGTILMDQNGDGTRTAIATITTFDMLIGNSIDGDQFAIDGLSYRADLPEDQRVINGNMSAFFTYDNWQLYQAYLNNTSLSIDLTFTRGSWSMQFTIHKFKIRGNVTPQVSGRGPLDIPMSFEAHRDDTQSPATDIDVVITNSDSSLDTAA